MRLCDEGLPIKWQYNKTDDKKWIEPFLVQYIHQRQSGCANLKEDVMKTYLINNNCIYNEQKYELRTSSNSQVIRMTAMRSKCLSFIIENAHLEIIERQKITNELWGSRSHFVNDANLTQILYLIRRDLKALGINDLFITIPRQGLQVNKDIAIEKVEPKKPKARKQFFRKTLAALTTVFSVTLGTMMYLHIH